MPSWQDPLYGGWDAAHQRLFDEMASDYISDIFYDDSILQYYIGILFGDEPIGGEHWNQIHEQLVEYMLREYDFNFDAHWDWEAWRELYSTS